MFYPQPGTFYRIQSADFDTCLELWDTTQELTVLRPFRETELQQWLFIKDSGPGNKYKIMAAETQSVRFPGYLAIATPGDALYPRPPAPPTATTDDASRGSVWQIFKQNDDSYALITEGKTSRHETFLRVSDTGMLDSVEKRASNNQSINRSERWKIVEYWPSVPQDTYSIRSLNGGALEVNRNRDGLSVGAVKRDSSQRASWLFEPKGNGNCVISLKLDGKVDDKLFLGWGRGKNGFARVAISKTPIEWFIRSLGEYTYSITLDYSVETSSRTMLTLALSIVDEEVLLKAKKIAHNQIWFLERVDASSSTDPPPPYPSARYPEITERNYALRNISTRQYLQFVLNPIWRVIPNSSRTVQVRVSYADSGDTFRLTHFERNECSVHFSGNVAAVSTASENGTLWILERADDPSGGFLYYICSALNRSQVLSGQTTPSEGYNVFTVTAKSIGNASQQWKFEI